MNALGDLTWSWTVTIDNHKTINSFWIFQGMSDQDIGTQSYSNANVSDNSEVIDDIIDLFIIENKMG